MTLRQIGRYDKTHIQHIGSIQEDLPESMGIMFKLIGTQYGTPRPLSSPPKKGGQRTPLMQMELLDGRTCLFSMDVLDVADLAVLTDHRGRQNEYVADSGEYRLSFLMPYDPMEYRTHRGLLLRLEPSELADTKLENYEVHIQTVSR